MAWPTEVKADLDLPAPGRQFLPQCTVSFLLWGTRLSQKLSCSFKTRTKPQTKAWLLIQHVLQASSQALGLGRPNRTGMEELMSSGHRKQGSLAKLRLKNQENNVSWLGSEKSLLGSYDECLVPIWWHYFGRLQNL